MRILRLTRDEFLGQDSVLNLISKLNHAINFLLSLLSLLDQFLEVGIHSVLSTQECIDEMLFERETCLDRFLSSPVLSMSLTLYEDLPGPSVHVHCSVRDQHTVLFVTSPYHRKRIASAPSVFSKRPR